MVNQQELWTERSTRRPCFCWSLRSGSRAKAPLCFCWSGSDCKMQPWEGLTHRCSDRRRRLRGAVLPMLPKVVAMPPLAFCPLFPALCRDKGCFSERVHLHLALLLCEEARCSHPLSSPGPSEGVVAFSLLLCCSEAVWWCSTADLPPFPLVSLLAASAKTGAARKDANGCGWAGSLGTSILMVGTERCLQSQGWGKSSSSSSCPGILRALSSSVFFHSPPLLLPFSSSRLPPSLSAKAIATDYPQACQGYRAGHQSTAYIYVSG